MPNIDSQIGRELLKQGFWFVDIPRTSSSSIRSELGAHFGVLHGKMNIPEKDFATPQHFADHRTALEMREKVGQELWSRLLTFSMVRNPWARALSFFSYRRGNARVKIPENWDLAEYLRHVARARAGDVHPVLAYPPQYATCSEFLTDETGQIIVSQIIRYENRASELSEIGAKIGFPDLGQRHINSTTPKELSLSDYYDAESKRLVAEIYAEDCERFGYSFPS
jgi:hypothetical protein